MHIQLLCTFSVGQYILESDYKSMIFTNWGFRRSTTTTFYFNCPPKFNIFFQCSDSTHLIEYRFLKFCVIDLYINYGIYIQILWYASLQFYSFLFYLILNLFEYFLSLSGMINIIFLS
ncbi:hypothetical protein ACJX0J_040525, partial [Zea mays]